MSETNSDRSEVLRPSVTDYSVEAYGRMIEDTVRVEAFLEGLRRTVTTDSVVLDIGAGTGIFSLLAARLGARRVIAIEPGEPIHAARDVAKDNGLEDRITFIQGISTALQPTERVDVVISDLRGALPLFESHIATIVDVRQRWLKSGGVLLSCADSVFMAPVHAPEAYDSIVSYPSAANHGLDLARLSGIASNTFHKHRIDAECVAGARQLWTTIDYYSVTSPDVSQELTWHFDDSKTLHGFVMWFESNVIDEVRFSNAPGERGSIHGHAFFPFLQVIEVQPGDEVSIRVDAKLIAGDYIWRWRTSICDSTGQLRESFDQSTLKQLVKPLDQLRAREEGRRTQMTTNGRIMLYTLSSLDEGRSLGEVADELVERFPDTFADRTSALRRAADAAAAFAE